MITTGIEPRSPARTLLLSLMAGVALPTVTMAQGRAAPESEIVVTAQKKSERLIDVPASP